MDNQEVNKLPENRMGLEGIISEDVLSGSYNILIPYLGI